MPEFQVALRTIPDTAAAIGRAGNHTVVIDRPEGRAGGMGLGFNGGQLLAIAIGGCLCNDLRYVAETRGIAIKALAIDVTVTMSGEPLKADHAEVRISVTPEDPASDASGLIAATTPISAVSNSVMRGFPVRFTEA